MTTIFFHFAATWALQFHMAFRHSTVTARGSDFFRGFFDYLTECIASYEITIPRRVVVHLGEHEPGIEKIALDSTKAPERDWRPRTKALLKAVRLATKGSYTKHIFPNAESVKKAREAEKEEWRGLGKKANSAQTRLIWAACLVARKIDSKYPNKHVKIALRERKKIHWTLAKIKMRVARYQRALVQEGFTLEGTRGILIDICDGFKRSQFVKRTGLPPGCYPMRDANGVLTGLCDKELETIRSLLQ